MAKKKPGKYTHLIDSLPKLPFVEPERREIVEAVKIDILAPPREDDMTSLDIPLVMKAGDTLVKGLCDGIKRATAGKHHGAEFARVYAELRAIKDKMLQWESNVNLLLEAYQALMLEQFEVEGITSLKLANGQPIYTHREPYAQVVDKEAFRLWCIADGLERSLVLPWTTANNLTKKRLIAGEPEPDGITIYAKTKIRLGSDGDEG